MGRLSSGGKQGEGKTDRPALGSDVYSVGLYSESRLIVFVQEMDASSAFDALFMPIGNERTDIVPMTLVRARDMISRQLRCDVSVGKGRVDA